MIPLQMPSKSKLRRKWLVVVALVVLVGYGVITGLAAWYLPNILLFAWTPHRTEAQLETIRSSFCLPGDSWTRHEIKGGEGVPIELHWLHRKQSRGVAIHLHGVFDDAWGASSPRLGELPDWDAVLFTFRGRDKHPEVPCTLGAWERFDVVAAVHFLVSQNQPLNRIIIVGNSMGAGTGLLALRELENQGTILGGALLESPFQDVPTAASNHIHNAIGPAELLLRPALIIGLHRLKSLARFDPFTISPLRASQGLRTPVALITGDADPITPLEGVQAIAHNTQDLTIVKGACHMCAGGGFPGGWRVWASGRLAKWGLAG